MIMTDKFRICTRDESNARKQYARVCSMGTYLEERNKQLVPEYEEMVKKMRSDPRYKETIEFMHRRK